MANSIGKGDLVVCYLMDSSLLNDETLLDVGVVIDTNSHLKDVLVYSSRSGLRWWPYQRWRILQKAKENS